MCSKWYPSVEGKRSIPFSPDQSVGGRLREHTLAFLLNCFPFTRTKGKILPLQLDQVEISVPTPKPVGGETRGKGGRHCSPLRRDGTGQKPHLPAGQDSTASSPLPSPAGAAQTFAAVRRGERDHFFPPPPVWGKGSPPRSPHARRAGGRGARRPDARLWPDTRALPLLLRPQPPSRERPRGAGRGAEAGHGHACLGGPAGGGGGGCARTAAEERPLARDGRSAPVPLLIARGRRRARRARGSRGQQRLPLKRATAAPPARASSSRLAPARRSPPAAAPLRRPSTLRASAEARTDRGAPVAAAMGPTVLSSGEGGRLAAASSGFFGASQAPLLAGVCSSAPSPRLPEGLGCLCWAPALLLLRVLVF